MVENAFDDRGAVVRRLKGPAAKQPPELMPKISVEIPQELLDDLDEHVGDDGKFVNRSDAIRASIRKTLDILDEIDDRHDRLEADE